MKHEERIALGELLEIRIGDIAVRTKLQQIISDREFIVLQPTVKGVPLRVEDRDVSLTFYRSNGCYSFEARMLAPFLQGNIMLCRIMRVSEIKRIQRRQCYRLPIVLDTVMVVDEEGREEQRFKGKTVDISEKSVALTCFAELKEDMPLTLEIRLSGSETIVTKARVLRCTRPLTQTDPYQIVLIFTNCDEKDQGFLRRYIFKQQILMRKKSKESSQ